MASSSCSSTMAAAASSLSSTGSDCEEKPHVLVVDELLVNRIINEELFINAGWKVTNEESGQRALEILGLGDGQDSRKTSDLKLDLIITDYSMVGMSGYQLLKKIKGSATTKDIPVVFLSYQNIPTLINKCLEEGALGFIEKPLKQSDVDKLSFGMMKAGKDLDVLPKKK